MSFPPILPAPSLSDDAPSPDPSSPRGSRKRRAPSHVSLNACTACKRARAKCDGEEPNPCSRCVARDMADQCHYEVHVKTVKEEMVRRIKILEQQNAQLQDFKEERERSDREKDLWIEAMFNAMAMGVQGSDVADKLRAGQSYEQIVEWLGHAPFGGITQLSPTSSSRLAQIAQKADLPAAPRDSPDYVTAMDLDATPEKQQPSHWTGIDVSEALVHHLMALYFTWIHPVHMLFSEKHFMESYQSGSNAYCSASLLNALCAMGCFFMSDRDKQGTNAEKLRNRFLDEVQKEIESEDRTRPTFASTYAVLFLIDVSSGQARKASAYLRLAAESVMHVDSARYASEVREVTLWGVHTLNIAWAGFTYQKPFAPISTKEVVFKNVERDVDRAYWQPYRSPGDTAASEIPSYAIETAKQLARLNLIIMKTINVYCGSRGVVTAHELLKLYRKYLQWKAGLPSYLQVEADDSQRLPHVHFLHAHYHVALCQLFQPLLYHGFSPDTLDLVKSIAVQTARDGLEVLQSYQRLFSNRHQVPLQLFCLVHVCDALVRSGPPELNKAEVVEFCLKGLHEASPCFAFVGPLQHMFVQMAREQGIAMPENINELMGGRLHYGPEELLDACERVTYIQPIEILLDRFDPAIAANFEREWQDFIERHGSGDKGGENLRGVALSLQQARSRSMQIGSFVNP